MHIQFSEEHVSNKKSQSAPTKTYLFLSHTQMATLRIRNTFLLISRIRHGERAYEAPST